LVRRVDRPPKGGRCFPTPALFAYWGRITRSDVIAAAADTNEHRINDRIRAREVRLVDPDGRQLGIKPLSDALAIARQLDLDLVEVAPNANPPVCRIMDFGKFKFDEAQRAKESRRKTTSSSIKEMKYRPKIGVGDFDTKTRQVTKFLGEGHKVKITIMFRGREVERPGGSENQVLDVEDRLIEELGDVRVVEPVDDLLAPALPDHEPELAQRAQLVGDR